MKQDTMPLAAMLALSGATSLSIGPELGQITVCNSTQNYAGSLAQDVQGYLAGLPANDNENLLNLLFPAIQTNDFFQFAKADDEFFLTEADDSDIRGIGAAFKRVQYRGSVVTAATQQKGLTMRVDHKTLPKVNGQIVAGWENRYAAALKNRLIAADIIRGLAVVEAAAVANNANKTWNGAANPDGDMRAAAQALRTANGMMPTHMVLGNLAMQKRQDSYEDATRVNHAMANHASYTPEQLASYLGVKKVVVADGIKQLKKGAGKTDMLAGIVYSYSAEESPVIDDPSNVKRAWSPTKSGSQWAVAIQEASVWTDITVWQDSLIFLPITSGMQKLTIS